MRGRITFVFLSVLLAACTNQQSTDKLKGEIQTMLKEQQGEFAVAFKDLSSGRQILINEHLMFHAASTMKTPVMIEVYKQASEGRFNLTDSVKVTTEFKSIVDSTFSLSPDDDSEHALYEIAG